ncbi:MAG: hypothetical protein JO251_15165 [Verrucomicrobia bacterium]|nr:hypothetical protein [Verrucomicrobiota bacterium]
MSTLNEIEAAVDRLSHPEQEILLEHLARKLGMRPPLTDGSRTQRERWVEPAVLPADPLRRNRSLQQVLDDIRAED